MIEEDRIFAVRAIDLRVVGEWTYAERHAADVMAFWATQKATNPKIFNGVVFILAEHWIDGAVFCGRYLKTDFASYLHWRELGDLNAGVCDGFASIYIHSAAGRILLARSTPHTVNAGMYTPPGGFVDGRDVGAGGRVGIAPYVLREMAEETGLDADDVALVDGGFVVRRGRFVAIAVCARAHLSEQEICARVIAHNKATANAEFGDVLWCGGEHLQSGIGVPETIGLHLTNFLQTAA